MVPISTASVLIMSLFLNSKGTLMTVADYNKLGVSKADHRIPYEDDPSQFGDLFLPSGNQGDDNKKLPVVVFLHGGCWYSAFNLEPVSGLCRALSDEGNVAVWNLEYRRLGNTGGWPNTFLDAANGVDALSKIGSEYKLDLTNLVASGHSAGGQLALWLAARPLLPKESPLCTIPNPASITSVVALAPVCDLERAATMGVCGNAASQLVLGDTSTTIPKKVLSHRYAQGSPSELLPLGVRHISINGAQDNLVPLGFVSPFVEMAQKAGDDASLIPINNAGHFELVTPGTKAGHLVMETILKEIHR